MSLPRSPVTFHYSTSREWPSRRPRWPRTRDLSQRHRRVLCWALYLEINEISAELEINMCIFKVTSFLLTVAIFSDETSPVKISGDNSINLEINCSHTFFSWKNCGYWTKRPFPFIVIDTNFDFIWWKGQDAFIPKDISWRVRRGDHSLYPCCSAIGAESNNIAKSFSIL